MNNLEEIATRGKTLLKLLEQFETANALLDKIKPTVMSSKIDMKDVKSNLTIKNIDMLVYINTIINTLGILELLQTSMESNGIIDDTIVMGELVVYEELSQLEKVIYALALIKTL